VWQSIPCPLGTRTLKGPVGGGGGGATVVVVVIVVVVGGGGGSAVVVSNGRTEFSRLDMAM
jgi:hypothetical protein